MQNFGIYIHIPFCKKKCKYCDFISFENCDLVIKEKYVDSLIKEIDNCNLKNKVNTIYIGGGTPSVLSSEAIKRILNKIYNKFEVDKNVEITIEINPGTVNNEKLKDYREIGINRLSIGLQSTNDRLLNLLGRIHTYEEFLEVYNNARNVGFDNINIDLMLGLPTQTLNELEESVQRVINLNPEHISIYSLILEEGTILEKMISDGEVEMISENLERKMYWQTKKMLENSGYNHYEISNFSKEGYQSKHNLFCWEQNEYIGFGIAAHSYIEKTRFCNIDKLDDYIKNIDENKFNLNKVLQEKKQNFEQEAKEYVMLGLRKIKGVSISKFEQKFNINPLFYFRFELNKLTNEELIEIDLDEIKLSKKGLDFANLVFEEFV